MRNILLLLCAGLLLNACGVEKVITGFYKPVPLNLATKAPEGSSPEYALGYEDGCESGLAAYGNYYYKTFYKIKSNAKLVGSPVYYNSWVDAFNYCRHYLNRYLAGGLLFGEGFGSNEGSVFDGSVQLRADDELNTETFSLFPGGFDPVDTPGWGATGWGGSVDDSSDFFGYEKRDWLGRLPKDQ